MAGESGGTDKAPDKGGTGEPKGPWDAFLGMVDKALQFKTIPQIVALVFGLIAIAILVAIPLAQNSNERILYVGAAVSMGIIAIAAMFVDKKFPKNFPATKSGIVLLGIGILVGVVLVLILYFSALIPGFSHIPPSLPQPPVAFFTANPYSGPATLTVHFLDKSINSLGNQTWDFGDNTTSTEKNPYHTYTKTGNYIVNLISRNTFGDSEPFTQQIIVTHPPWVASFDATPTSGIAPLTVNFTDTSPNSPDMWFWDFGDHYSSRLKNPGHNYTAPGNYQVTLIVANEEGMMSKPWLQTINVASSIYSTFFDTWVNTTGADLNTSNIGTMEIKSSGMVITVHAWQVCPAKIYPALCDLGFARADKDDRNQILNVEYNAGSIHLTMSVNESNQLHVRQIIDGRASAYNLTRLQ